MPKVRKGERGAPVKRSSDFKQINMDKRDLAYHTETEILKSFNPLSDDYSQKMSSVITISYDVKPDDKFPFDTEKIDIGRD
jgi:hypothetical protein